MGNQGERSSSPAAAGAILQIFIASRVISSLKIHILQSRRWRFTNPDTFWNWSKGMEYPGMRRR
jgi:hypothetical protein